MHDDVQGRLDASLVVAAINGDGFRHCGDALRPLLVAVAASVGAEAAWAALVDPGGGRNPHLRLLAHVGYEAHELAGWERFPSSLNTPATEAMRLGRPVHVGPDELAERYPVIAQVSVGRALLAVPLVVAGEAVGATGMRLPTRASPPAPELLSLAALSLSHALEDRARILLAGRGRF